MGFKSFFRRNKGDKDFFQLNKEGEGLFSEKRGAKTFLEIFFPKTRSNY